MSCDMCVDVVVLQGRRSVMVNAHAVPKPPYLRISNEAINISPGIRYATIVAKVCIYYRFQ
jgi:hypothetical protein